MRGLLALAAVCAAAGGCSTPNWDTPHVHASELAWARSRIATTHVPPPRGDSEDVYEVAVRVNARIRPAVQRVCRRMYASGCETVTSKRAAIDVPNPGVNAYVDANNRVSLLGGMVRSVGSDDELAAVIAHEYAHVMLGHVHQMQSNAGLGALTGAIAGMAIGYGLYTPGSTVIEDFGAKGYDVGRNVGGFIFTKEMEREADHVAAYILHEAGYKLEAGRNLWVRLAREVHSGTVLGYRSLRGYFRTHPTTEARYVAWEKSIREVRSGQRRPLTLKERRSR